MRHNEKMGVAAAGAVLMLFAGSATAATVKVNVGVKALASFTASPTSASAGTPIAFTVTPGTGANVQNVRVDFGDGASQTLGAISGAATVTHQYGSAGNYTATATATDAAGTSTLSTNVIIGALQVVLNATSTSPKTGESVTFTVGGVTGVQVQGYQWVFSDGATYQTSSPSTSHVFTTRGNQVIRVDVIGVSGGVIGTAALNLNVS
jgi:PKD repeat protein